MSDIRSSQQPPPDELRSEPVPLAASGGPPVDPPEASREPEDRHQEALLRFWLAAVGFAAVAVFVAATESDHPPIDASITTSLPSPQSITELSNAAPEAPVEASLESFAINRIPPSAETAIAGRGMEMLIRMRVSRSDCSELEAEIGGSCDGRPRPPLHAIERFTARSSAGPISALISSTQADVFRLGQNGAPTRQGPPDQWWLVENAGRTKVNLICRWDIPLAVTLLPGRAEVECSPDEAVFKLLWVNRSAYAPTLSLGRVDSFEARLRGRRATMAIDDGLLRLGGSETEIQSPRAKRIALDAAGSDFVHLKTIAPTEDGGARTSLTTPGAAQASIGGDELMPSWLDRHDQVQGLAYSAAGGLLLGAAGALLALVIVRRRGSR